MKKLLAALAMGASFALALPAAHAGTPKDTLIQADHLDDIITLDPAEMYELTTYEINGNVYDTLVAINGRKTSEILHKAALSWNVSDDGKTYTFKLRPNMKFQSGNPLTAADVVYSFQRLTALNKSPAFLIQDFGISTDNMNTTLKAVDDLTFQMTVDQAYAPSFVINKLCATNFAIVDSVLLKSKEAKQADGSNDWGNGWLKTNSAGSGPFAITEWKPSEVVTVVANPNYWGTKPKLKRIVWRHIAEESSQRLLLESGDVDIARNLSADQLEGVRQKGGFKFAATPQNNNLYAGLNTKNQYLANPKVREALRYLIDYDGLAKTALRDRWVINETFLPNGVLGYIDSRPYKLDIAKAKQLLTEAGYADGFPLTVNVASTEQSRMDIAQAMQQTFAKVGIKLQILASDQKTVITTYRARKHDMALLTWGIDYFDPNTNMAFVVNTDNSDKPKSKPLAWRNGWMNEDFNKQAAALLMETDSAKRKAGYQAMIKAWQPISPFIMMFQENQEAALSPKVHNFFIGPNPEMTPYDTVYKQ
jgi:peptide/nickel transport system substrate-binding protein